MGYRDDPLWQGLAAMRIEPEGASLTFCKRLARENGWSKRFAAEVIEEYRRFVYLAATGSTPVTPSEEIDQVWHLHLAYTRHYWGVLCGEIIGQPLHHGPTAGGSAEARKYRGHYAGTLARYRKTFGHEPPPAIWPTSQARFAGRFQRVDRSRHMIVARRPFNIAALIGGAGLLAACTALAATGGKPLASDPDNFFFSLGLDLPLYAAVFVFFVLFAVWRVIARAKNRSLGQPPGAARQRKRQRGTMESSGGSGYAADSSSSGAAGAATGGAAFAAGGGDFGGSGADGNWDNSDSGSGSSDSGCSSSGCGGGCGGGGGGGD